MAGKMSGGSGGGGGGANWQLSYADDPTDWDEEHAYLRPLDASLRCALCYDIFTAPVAIKDCAHTFCSACIRRAINKPGEEMGSRCPTCMGRNVYDSSLLPQPTLELAAQHWRHARPQLYKRQSLVQSLQQRLLEEQAASASTSSAKAGASAHQSSNDTLPHKRPKMCGSSSQTPPTPSSPPRRRSARASAMRGRPQRSASPAEEGLRNDESDGGSEYLEQAAPSSESTSKAGDSKPSASKDYRQMQASDMVECPLCGHSFTLVALNRHLDKGTCQPGDPEPSPQERGLPIAPREANGTTSGRAGWFQKQQSASSGSGAGSSTLEGSSGTFVLSPSPSMSAAPRKKLVRPNYDMVKLPDLKRLLEEHRLASSGDRKRLVERHRMWANLFNANLDASEKMRKTESQLRRELETWERAQDHALHHCGVSEKRAKTWTTDYADDFRRLAQQARESHLRNRLKHKEGMNGASEGPRSEEGPVAAPAEGNPVKSNGSAETVDPPHSTSSPPDVDPASSSPPFIMEPEC